MIKGDRMDNNTLIKRCFTVPKREIGYLRFTFEGYDGLIFMRTLKAADGLIEIGYPPELREDAEALLVAVDLEVGLVEAERPSAADYDVI
jgi:hypothetical protein